MNNTLLDPCNDFVFKTLFVNALPLLADLINAVRPNEAPIDVLEVTNPRIEAEELHGKYIILDILAKDKQGHLYDIEMQVSRQEKWSARSMYYLSKTLAGQLNAGEKYSTLKPVIGIHLLAYDLFDDPQQALWCFEMRDRTQPSVLLGSELQLNILELAKADRLAHARQLATTGKPDMSALAAWIMYFKHSKEEDIMNQIVHPPVIEAFQQLQQLSGDADARRLADVRERALIAERTEIEAAEERGEARGEARGKAIGEAHGEARANQRALLRLIESGMSEAQAKAILGL